MAAFLAAVLLPILYMTSGDGPTNLIPFSMQALAKSPLSPGIVFNCDRVKRNKTNKIKKK